MNVSNVSNASDLARAMNGMLEKIKDEQGTLGVSDVKFSATSTVENSLTVSFTGADGAVHSVEVPELDFPKGTLSSDTLMTVLNKLDDSSTDVKIPNEAKGTLKEIANDYVKSAQNKLQASKAFNTNISVYDIMQEILYLLIDCANEQMKSSRASKFAAQMQEYAAILSQAETQKNNAITGMVTSIVSGAMQFIVTAALSGGSKDVAKVKEENGVQTSLKNFENSELMGDPVKANAAMKGTAKSLQISEGVQAEVSRAIDGKPAVDPTTGEVQPFSEAQVELSNITDRNSGAYQAYDQAKTDLPGAQAELQEAQNNLDALQTADPPTPKKELAAARQRVSDAQTRVMNDKNTVSAYEGQVAKLEQGVKVADAKANLERVMGDPNAKPEDIAAAQESYRAEVDKSVKLYRQDAAVAREEYMAVRDNPKATKAERAAAKEKLDTAQKNWQYANAARTNALSQSIDGQPVISKGGIKAEVAARREEFAEAKGAAEADPAMEKAKLGMDNQTKRELVMTVCRTIDNVAQNVIKLLDSEGTRKSAQKTKAERDAQIADEYHQDSRKLFDAAMQLAQTLNSSIQNARIV